MISDESGETVNGPTPKHAKTHAEIIKKLDAIANGKNSPSAELLHAAMACQSSKATARAKRRYEALRKHMMNEVVKAPDGHSYKLKSLQRDYLRYSLVERYLEYGGVTWNVAYVRASEYLSQHKPVAPDTVRDSHAKIKKMLNSLHMAAFCKGLEYDFQHALDMDAQPMPGTILDPDFLKPKKTYDHS